MAIRVLLAFATAAFSFMIETPSTLRLPKGHKRCWSLIAPLSLFVTLHHCFNEWRFGVPGSLFRYQCSSIVHVQSPSGTKIATIAIEIYVGRQLHAQKIFNCSKGVSKGLLPLASDVEITSDFTKNIYLDIACYHRRASTQARYPQSTEVFSGWGGGWSEIYPKNEVKKIDFLIFIFLLFL